METRFSVALATFVFSTYLSFMTEVSCATCRAVMALGAKTAPLEGEMWPNSVPAEADALEVFAPGSGHSHTVQIRRCRDCGTLYRYRYHSEYDVSGSWDDYFFWRMSDAAQENIGRILQMPKGSRAPAHTAALKHSQADVREDAALLLWILMDDGEPMSAELLEAACFALADSTYLVGNYCYRGLLSFAFRGKAEAGLLQVAVNQAKQTATEDRFGWILLKECAEIMK